jgi:hypothetical protein
MTDSWGDTWNGGTLTIDGVTYDQPTTSASSGAGASDTYTLCVDLSTCIDVTYSAGGFSSENSWSISDASGAVLASGGAVSGQIGSCPILGCTDPAAVNYDASANTDDGSCAYACTAAPFYDNLDDAVTLLTGWTSLGWSYNSGGTPSSTTGPSDDLTGGGSYLFYETSGVPAASISLESECYDISTLAAPAFFFCLSHVWSYYRIFNSYC